MSGHRSLPNHWLSHLSIAKRAGGVVANLPYKVGHSLTTACSRAIHWEQISETEWPLKSARKGRRSRVHVGAAGRGAAASHVRPHRARLRNATVAVANATSDGQPSTQLGIESAPAVANATPGARGTISEPTDTHSIPIRHGRLIPLGFPSNHRSVFAKCAPAVPEVQDG
jgi:hypothetical protein